jgi:predicted NBD/HSP70 family sugar kinase
MIRVPGPPTPTSPATPTSSLARALTLLHLGGLTRRSELTAELGLTRTATGTVLRELEQLGLVVTRPDAGPGAGTGRPSHGVQISPQAPMALAVHVGVETMTVTEAQLGGRLGPVREVPLPDPATPDAVLGRVVDQVRLRLAAAMRPCVGIGVALPSAVGNDGSALAANNLYWPQTVPVREVLTRLLADLGHGSLPLAIGNDANLAALGESRHGAGRGSRHLLLVTTGQQGVGGGLVINGRPYTGSAGYGLEVGHIQVAADRLCHCGNSGCLEAETDPKALLEAAGGRGAGRTLQAARAVVTAAAGGDRAARAAVTRITERLAAGLASLVNVLNPDRIVLGGLYADLLRASEMTLRVGLAYRSFLDHAAAVDLRPAALTHPSLVGAAELALQPLLDDPRRGRPAAT